MRLRIAYLLVRRWAVNIFLVVFLCSPAFGATLQSIASGAWTADAATVWDTGIAPANGDTVNVNGPHNVTFDADMSGWANGVTLIIDSGATLTIKDDGGSYYLMTSADITHDGTMQAGTSASVPFTGTFTLDFNLTASSIICSGGGVINFYCIEATNKFVKLTAQEPGAETVLAVDTDVTADIWAIGDVVEISEGGGYNDTESDTIAAIAAGTITITGGLAAQKEIDSFVTLVTRNIRIINSTTFAIEDVDNSTINCAVYDCTHGIDGSTTGGNVIGGAIKGNEATGVALKFIYSSTINAALVGTGNGLSYCYNCEVTSDAVVAGCYYSCLYSRNMVLRGNWTSARHFVSYSSSIVFAATHTKGYLTAIVQSNDIILQDVTIDTGLQAISIVEGITASGCTFQNNTRDLADQTTNGRFYNCLFASGTEFNNYNDENSRGTWCYVESLNHDQVESAYKAWCVGGIVTSQTASPPTGYSIWYELACESASYPCFRQYKIVVLPGTAIEVEGYIRIADAVDHTSYPPALQIIDVFADPLVDQTQNPLAEDEIPIPDGSDATWQAVSVIWANQGASPKNVIVRMIAQNAAADVDTVWAIADYQDQIAAIYNKLPSKSYLRGTNESDGGMDSDDVSDVNTAVWTAKVSDFTGETTFGGEVGGLDPNLALILADTNELQTDWTDDGRLDVILDAIKAITDILPALTTTVASPNDANNFTLTAGVAVADAYNGMTVYIQDADDSHWESRLVIDWTAARVMDVDEPFGFTPAAGDVVYLWGQAYFPMDIWDSLPIPLPKPVVSTIDTRAAGSSGVVGGTKTFDWERTDP